MKKNLNLRMFQHVTNTLTTLALQRHIQSDQKENKSEQALQIIIGHVMAEFYANTRSMHGRRQFVVSNATL
jgi:hypothetical protein